MTPEDHQKKIAIDTLRLSIMGARCLGGMDHPGAIKFLVTQGIMTELQVESRLFAAGHSAEDIRTFFKEAS